LNKIIKFEGTELNVIEKSRANQIKIKFITMVEKVNKFIDPYNELIKESEKEITSKTTKIAKRLRLDIAKVRTETEEIRKKEKSEYLNAGKSIDKISNSIKEVMVKGENALKAIENHFEIQEKKRLETLQESRRKEIFGYLNLSIGEGVLDFAAMTDDVWQAYFQGKKKKPCKRN